MVEYQATACLPREVKQLSCLFQTIGYASPVPFTTVLASLELPSTE